jgi:fucose 4-O-acetylase-like acetyltransferase
MNLNLLKGILILLVIVDHNDFSRSIFPGFLLGFGFHVVGFLTIPFLKPAPVLDKAMGAYLFRLYWPFAVMATLMTVAVGLLGHVPASQQFERWLLMLYSGNSALLKQTTGMALLWFLPSFVALVTLRSAIEHAGKPLKAVAIGLLCVAHLFIGTVAPLIRDFLPLGLLPALYVIPLAYLGVWAQRTLFARLSPALALLLAVALFVPVKYLQIDAYLYNEVGFAEVADFRAPGALLLNDLESVLGVLMLFQVCRFQFGAFLQACGRYSMQIYLFHAFIAAGIYKLVARFAPDIGSIPQFALSVAATAVLTLLLARWLAERRLAQRFLFPRGPQVLLRGVGAPGQRLHGLAAKPEAMP